MAGRGSEESVLLPCYCWRGHCKLCFSLWCQPGSFLPSASAALDWLRGGHLPGKGENRTPAFASAALEVGAVGASLLTRGRRAGRQLGVPHCFSSVCSASSKSEALAKQLGLLLVALLAALALRWKRMEEAMALRHGVGDKRLGARSSSSGCSGSGRVPGLGPGLGAASAEVACPTEPRATLIRLRLSRSLGPS